MRLPEWTDWFTLVLMSFSSPLIAAYIHSVCVFQRGFRLYNAEIGGKYFLGVNGSMPPYQLPSFGLGDILALISGCAIPGILTFLIILSFRQRALYRWIVWTGFIVIWTWTLFQMEVSLH